jgi:hypothetical protein
VPLFATGEICGSLRNLVNAKEAISRWGRNEAQIHKLCVENYWKGMFLSHGRGCPTRACVSAQAPAATMRCVWSGVHTAPPNDPFNARTFLGRRGVHDMRVLPPNTSTFRTALAFVLHHTCPSGGSNILSTQLHELRRAISLTQVTYSVLSYMSLDER